MPTIPHRTPSVPQPHLVAYNSSRIKVDRIVKMTHLVAILIAILCAGHVAITAEAGSYYEKFGPYYMHDIIFGANATDVVLYSGSTNYNSSTTKMGGLTVFDDPITMTSNASSTVVGRAQGMQVVDSLDGRNSLITLTLLLTNGTMSFQGAYTANTTTAGFARLHCLGGTGEFQSVTRGYFDWLDYKYTILKVTVYYHRSKKYV